MTPEREADIRRTWEHQKEFGHRHDWVERPVLNLEMFASIRTPQPKPSVSKVPVFNREVLRFEGTIIKDARRPGWRGLEVRCEGVLVWFDEFVNWRQLQIETPHATPQTAE